MISSGVEVCGAEEEGRLRGPSARLAPIFTPESVNLDQQSRDQTDKLENDDDVDRMDED